MEVGVGMRYPDAHGNICEVVDVKTSELGEIISMESELVIHLVPVNE